MRQTGVRPKTRLRTPLLIAGFVILLFFLLSLSLKHSPALGRVEGALVSLSAPGLAAIHYVVDSLQRLWAGYFFLVGLREKNEALQRRLDDYLPKEVQYQEAVQTLKRLEALLELRQELALPVTAARVIAYDPSLWSRCLILDKGKNQGVQVGFPVLVPTGVVGRVVEAYPEYAKVMLIVDRNSGADATLQRTRGRGILQGKGGNRCSLEYLPKNADVQIGDLVLTSGLGGIYPKGLALGHVTAIDKKVPGAFQEIEVTPTVDLSSLEEVLIARVANYLLKP